MADLLDGPLFGIVLSLLAYEAGIFLERKTKSTFANPLLIAVLLCVTVLVVSGIPLASFNAGASLVAVFLTPATTVIAVSIYQQWALVKKYFWPLIAGTVVGSAASIASAVVLCGWLGLDPALTKSMAVKSVSTPFALALSESIGGVPSVAVTAVILTGILGAVASPALVRLLRMKNPVVVGVAIGTSSHVIGTSRAVTLGEVEGAMSGVALGFSGLVTIVLLSVFRF